MSEFSILFADHLPKPCKSFLIWMVLFFSNQSKIQFQHLPSHVINRCGKYWILKGYCYHWFRTFHGWKTIYLQVVKMVGNVFCFCCGIFELSSTLQWVVIKVHKQIIIATDEIKQKANSTKKVSFITSNLVWTVSEKRKIGYGNLVKFRVNFKKKLELIWQVQAKYFY